MGHMVSDPCPSFWDRGLTPVSHFVTIAKYP